MDHDHRSHAPASDSAKASDSADASDSAEASEEMLELDAQVLHAYLSDAISWVRHLAKDQPSRRVVDLGSGTGSATVALAQTFPSADVIAVDNSAELLTRVRAKARHLGAADRITTLQADLDDPWPILEDVDVVWASMSLHHLADPDRVLADVLASIRPGGLVVVAEQDAFPRFLLDDLGIGRPGLEARCHAALADAHARQMPLLGSDWGPRLSYAGFAAVTKRTFDIDLDPPLPASTGRYAQTFFKHIRSRLEGIIAADDQATLDTLIDSNGPHSVLRRHDITVRGTRTTWAGTKPCTRGPASGEGSLPIAIPRSITMTRPTTNPGPDCVTSGRDQSASLLGVDNSDAEWDERYASAERVWSGQPNAALVTEVSHLEPGMALDVGCGEGADAIWLASRGWKVTAIDVSRVALQRAAIAAEQTGAHVAWMHASLLGASLPAGFDLVSAQYPALLRTPTHDAERTLLDAVAPGGHLLVVHHADVDIEEAKAHGFDPTEYVSPRDVASLLDDSWQIAFDERRPRHLSAGAGAHHTHDVVLHAQRLLQST